MNRRSWLTATGVAGVALLGKRQASAQEAAAKAVRGLPAPKIKDIQVITCAPSGVRLVVVKILTDQAGLHGYGCATFTQRADLVVAAVEKYLKPFLLGKPADRIDDTWQACYNSSYWRNGPVLNNAISGVDQALWDIKARQANMPVYQVLGGKMREAADCYAHASGAEIPEVVNAVKGFVAQGFRHVRIQVGLPGMAGYGAGAGGNAARSQALHNGPVYEPAPYLRRTLKLFEEVRKRCGDEVELLHDVHERVLPSQALQLCRDLEKFRPFFVEDPFSPEDLGWFRIVRQQCSTPLAMGELFNSPHEWTPLIAERLIDFIRVHVSQAGGVTPARKIAILGELFGVRTAWHGPGDVSPVGHAANLALDLVSYNFGIQESVSFDARTREIFSGLPEMKNGYMYPNEAPGWGIEVNDKAAARYPFGGPTENQNRVPLNGGWGEIRRRDGTIIKQ